MLRQAIEAYIKGCNVCLTSKGVWHKLYGDFQLLLDPTHRWKNLLMDLIIGLPVSTNWKSNSYDLILIIVNQLTKMVYYVPVKVTINALDQAKMIIDIVVCHHKVSKSIVTDRGLLLTSKFWSLLCYFLEIKRKLSTTFHPQTDGQTKR